MDAEEDLLGHTDDEAVEAPEEFYLLKRVVGTPWIFNC